MRIKNLQPVSVLRQQLGIAVQSTPVPDVPLVNFEVQPSTDELKLNKTERAWLEEMRRRGYRDIGVQDVTLKLGADLRYTCDFNAIVNGRWTFYEVKGFMRDDARCKLLMAARKYRQLDFVKVERIKGDWIETPIKP